MRATATILLGLAVEVAGGATPSLPTGVERLVSPNGRIAVAVHTAPRLSYDVLFDGRPLLQGATLSLDVDGVRLGSTAQITGVERTRTDATVTPPVRQTAASLVDRHNDLRLACAGGYAITFRAYDLGVAYRFETSLPRAEVKITGEEASFRFAADAPVYYPREESFFSHNERQFKRVRLGELPAAALGSIPAVVETSAGPKVAIAESDLEDYPGLWLRGTGGPALIATFPPYPIEEKLTRDRDFRVKRAADYIAITRGTRTFPWRVLGGRRARRRPRRQSARLPAGAPVADRGHLVDPSRQGRLGLVERTQPARCEVQARGQQRDLPGVHRLRRAVRPALHHPRRGLVQDGQPLVGDTDARHAEAARRTRATSTSASSCGRSGRRWPTSSDPRWPSSKGGASPG